MLHRWSASPVAAPESRIWFEGPMIQAFWFRCSDSGVGSDVGSDIGQGVGSHGVRVLVEFWLGCIRRPRR